MSVTIPSGPICCVCGGLADVVIRHPEHGERVVCEDDTNGYEVIRRV